MKPWLLAVVLLLVVALSVVIAPAGRAAAPVGLMTVSGPVRISGSEFEPKAVSSWAVLAGDEIVTEQGARAVLVSPTAGRLEIRHGSRVTTTETTALLHEGEVGAERFVVRTGPYTATPHPDAHGKSWFVVSRRNGVPVFAAHQGDLWVSQGEPSPLLVRAGTYAVPAAAPDPREPVPQTQRAPAASGATAGAGAAAPGNASATGPAGTQGAAGAPTAQQYEIRPNQSAALPGTQAAATAASSGWTVGSLSHASSIALVSGVSAAAIAGTVTGVALVEPSVQLPDRSPANPE
jgi:hypothetical protein